MSKEELNPDVLKDGFAALTDDDLSSVNGGGMGNGPTDKSKHVCPFCGHKKDYVNWKWDNLRFDAMVRCDKCRHSYAKSEWDQ